MDCHQFISALLWYLLALMIKMTTHREILGCTEIRTYRKVAIV